VSYALHIGIVLGIFGLLALSLDLVLGKGGMLSLCHAAFYGIGAYASALLMLRAHVGFVPACLASAALAALVSLAISVPAVRLRGDYFVLASLGLQIMAHTVIENWESLTQGTYGLSAIPRPVLLRIAIDSPGLFLAFEAVVAGLVIATIVAISRSPFGRTLRAIRDDDIAAQAQGKSVMWFKTRAFAVSAACAAVAGALYAGYVTYIDPSSFGLPESLFIVACVAIGGAGNTRGPLVGAAVLVLLPELLRALHVPDTIAPTVREMVYGALIVVFMRLRPQGLFGVYLYR
jgi:branched-chain amino acid transport system permease protein